MSPERLVLATRRSALALAQARAFAHDLEDLLPGLAVEELEVVTTGDKVQNVPLAEVGGKGLFTKEIEEALDRGDADFAVHSFKDVPSEIAAKFVIACVPLRADGRDVLITKSGAKLADLEPGSRLGTSSMRRSVQVSLARPDLVVVPLRGNVDTRLRKLDHGEIEAIMLARAGLERLGLASRITETIPSNVVIPAAGQGALAIECRAADHATREVLGKLTDVETEIAVACERSVMKSVGGDCNVPFGAHAWRRGNELVLLGFLAGPDGTHPRRVERVARWPDTPEEAAALGREAAKTLLDS